MMKKTGKSFKFVENVCGKCTRTCKIPIVIICLIWLVISIYFGRKIPRQGLDKHIFDRQVPIQKTSDILEYKLGKDDYFNLHIIIGIKPDLANPNDINNERLSFWKLKKQGQPVFDANFDMSSENN